MLTCKYDVQIVKKIGWLLELLLTDHRTTGKENYKRKLFDVEFFHYLLWNILLNVTEDFLYFKVINFFF